MLSRTWGTLLVWIKLCYRVVVTYEINGEKFRIVLRTIWFLRRTNWPRFLWIRFGDRFTKCFSLAYFHEISLFDPIFSKATFLYIRIEENFKLLTKYYDYDKNLEQKWFVEKISSLPSALVYPFSLNSRKAPRPKRVPEQDIWNEQA